MNENTSTATAKHYGQMIARDLELLDTIADLYNGSRGETWREMIAEHSDDVDERQALETFLESGNVFSLDDTAEDGEHPLEAWVNDSLEITETGTRSFGGAWESDGFKILISFGGPNCWLEITPRGNSVYTAWGSDSHREPVDVSTIETWLDGLSDDDE